MAAYRRIPIHTEPDWPERRRVLKLMAASAALATAGCSGPPPEFILPYVRAPEQAPVGEPVFYASALLRGGHGQGVLVECQMGRPVKVEGNRRHPSSLGAADAPMQASILQLWDPDRSQLVMQGGSVSDWRELEQALAARRAAWDASRGEGLRILTGTVTSPTLAAQLEQVLARYPAARWHQHDPLHDDTALAAAQLAFGRAVDFVASPQQARVVLCFDADPLAQGPGSIAFARQFMQGRRAEEPQFQRRMYVLETCPTLTGIAADQRLALPPAQIESMVARLGARFGVCAPPPRAERSALELRWEAALAAALEDCHGASLLLGGGSLGVEARAIVHALNVKLGNMDRTLRAVRPAEYRPESHAASLAALAADMRAGKVDTLMMLEVNPAYDAPGALGFARALRSVPLSLHLGLYRDETARASSWHVPATHAFEHWSDVLAYDGTPSIVQPVIAPLYGGRSVHALLAWTNGEGGVPGLELVQRTWRGRRGGQDFETFWASALQHGVAGPAAVALELPPPPQLALGGTGAEARRGLPAVLRSDTFVGAGEFANSGWLQELPHPVTGITWDNAVLLGPLTARRQGISSGDIVRLGDGERSLEAPAWVLAGHAEGCLSLQLGYGRRAAGAVGNGVGYDAYPLRPVAGGPARLAIDPTGRRHSFALPQTHTRQEGRALARSGSLDQFRGAPRFAHAGDETAPGSLYPPVAYDSYKWGMAIDLNACIGCAACTVACQAENNIPVVGKDQVQRGRIMHWIRVDRYEEGGGIFQPVPCMHCEDAPCEEVCPVGATVHDEEGINVQVYNRCIGTRFCSNNCPYKVRRFNFLQYAGNGAAEAARRNPEVSVRRRGVMEKCNYCLQRITRARLDAELLGRPLRDGEVVTACQAACPTAAIVFGDLNDPQSAVNRAKASPLDYALLGELNTRPRTSYAARVRNLDGRLA